MVQHTITRVHDWLFPQLTASNAALDAAYWTHASFFAMACGALATFLAVATALGSQWWTAREARKLRREDGFQRMQAAVDSIIRAADASTAYLEMIGGGKFTIEDEREVRHKLRLALGSLEHFIGRTHVEPMVAALLSARHDVLSVLEHFESPTGHPTGNKITLAFNRITFRNNRTQRLIEDAWTLQYPKCDIPGGARMAVYVGATYGPKPLDGATVASRTGDG